MPILCAGVSDTEAPGIFGPRFSFKSTVVPVVLYYPLNLGGKPLRVQTDFYMYKHHDSTFSINDHIWHILRLLVKL